MDTNSRHPPLTRRAAAMALLATVLCVALAGCGGGSSGSRSTDGTIETRALHSNLNGSDYPLSIYLPPASTGNRDGLPTIYVLDGETWFKPLVDIVESTKKRVIVVGIKNSALRNRDFVPPNACTPGGGGNVAYFDFIRRELIPFVEGSFGGDSRQRALFGHSHGGSFVLYAMFAESSGSNTFKSYLSSDSSVSCMNDISNGWERTYALANRDLPVRLHFSYATQGNYATNLLYANLIALASFGRLVMTSQAYTGTHESIVPLVLKDALGFVVAGSP